MCRIFNTTRNSSFKNRLMVSFEYLRGKKAIRALVKIIVFNIIDRDKTPNQCAEKLLFAILAVTFICRLKYLGAPTWLILSDLHQQKSYSESTSKLGKT